MDNIESRFLSLYLKGGQTITITFDSYDGSAILSAYGTMVHYNNGYLNAIASNSNISYSVSSDYKTISVKNNTGANNYHLSLIVVGNMKYTYR